MMDSEQTFVWVFVGSLSKLPSAVFDDKEAAFNWIEGNRLSGILTGYPLGVPVVDWALQEGIIKQEKARMRDPDFVGNFTSASLEHFHCIEGVINE